jgi:hypothetical protein
MSNYWYSMPGFVPGRHTVSFYQGSQSATTGFAGPATSTTTRVSDNMTVTATSQQTQTIVKFTRSSDLLTLENDYEAGKVYMLVNGADGKPLIIPAGYTEWYWEWRKASKKADEAVLTVNDKHYRFADGAWRFNLLIDGEVYTYFDMGQKKEIVVPKGRHTLSIIDKQDPLSETVSFSAEMNVDDDALELEVTGTKSAFYIKPADAQLRSDAALDTKVVSGESVLEIHFSKKSSLALEFILDGASILSSKEQEAVRRFKIPNGLHSITGKLFSYPNANKEFTANSNLIIATFKQGTFVNSLEIEERPME